MPQQLIYTSSPRGLMAGRSGYCIVACSEGMRDALQLNLEQLSYYDHLTGASGGQPVVNAYRILNIRGSLYHVLSRIADAGLDFTKRTNFIAHHLVFQVDELQTQGKSLPISPAVVFLHWNGWCSRWDGESQWLKNTDWGNLLALAGNLHNPAQRWQELTGDAANGLALWDSTSQDYFSIDGLRPQQLLGLLAESLALSAVRPANGGPWEQTFTTYLQERDDVADFRWRMVQSATIAYDRLATRNVVIKPLGTLRPKVVDELAAAFARSGPQPLRITGQPEDKKLRAGQPLILKVVCSGVPPPQKYQWYTCPRTGNRQVVNGGNGPELRIDAPPRGASRYVAVITDDNGRSVESRVATVEMELDKARLSSATGPASTPVVLKKQASVTTDDEALEVRPQKWKDSDSEDNEWESLETEEEESAGLNWMWIGIGAFLVVFGAMAIFLIIYSRNPKRPDNASVPTVPVISTTNETLVKEASPMPENTQATPLETAPAGAEKPETKKVLIILATRLDRETIATVTNKNLRAQAESDYDNQKNYIDQELHDKLSKLFRFSPDLQVHIQTVDLNEAQTNQVMGGSLFDFSSDRYHFQLTADTNEFFSITGMDILRNKLSGPLLMSAATNTEFVSSTRADLLVWPAGVETFFASCSENGTIQIPYSSLLDVLNEFNESGNYQIEVNIGYLKGPREYAFSTNFVMAANQRYFFEELPKMLVLWQRALTAVTNITALDTGSGSLVTTKNIWDELGEICQHFTGFRASYDFREDHEGYTAARQQVLADLKTQDERDRVNSVLSDENLENLKAFLNYEPNILTFGSARDRLRFLLPTRTKLSEKLQATITIKGGKAPLALLKFN